MTTAGNLHAMLALAAAVIGGSAGLLQARHTVTARRSDGITVGVWTVMTAGSGLWLAYGAVTHSIPQILANLPWLVATCALGWILVRERRVPPVVAVAAPVVVMTAGALLHIAGTAAFTAVGMAIALTGGIRQWTVARRSTCVDGLSLRAGLVNIAAGVCWIVYGYGTRQIAVVACSAVTTVCTGLVTRRVASLKRRTVTPCGTSRPRGRPRHGLRGPDGGPISRSTPGAVTPGHRHGAFRSTARLDTSSTDTLYT